MPEILQKFSWKAFLQGLVAAGVGGAVSFGGQAVATGVVNKSTAITAGTGAALTMGAYLLQSPLLKPRNNMETTRMVILPIDTICALFKDYCGQVGFPKDAVPVKLRYKASERGKLALVVESDEFTGEQAPEEIRFDIRRYFGVGGGN